MDFFLLKSAPPATWNCEGCWRGSGSKSRTGRMLTFSTPAATRKAGGSRGRRGITVVTPLNRNRWNLNLEATLAFQQQHKATLRIFISTHKWKDGQPTEEEALMVLNHGDDSAIPVPAVFMFVPGMPVVVNHNTHQGVKLVNGAGYTAVDVVVDKVHPGYCISADTILHFGPPAGILLASDMTKGFHFVGMPPGTIPERLAMHVSLRVHRLQSPRQDLRTGGPGAAGH